MTSRLNEDIRVSIIYPTARRGGFDILENSVNCQTHANLEVVVIDELHRHFGCRKASVINLYPPAHKPGTFWNLSASLNAGCRAATGELIVLLQDYIWMPPDAIERYVTKYLLEGPKCLVTGVSDQFACDAPFDPNDVLSCWIDGFPGPPSGEIIFKDPRHADRAGFFVTIPLEWEANWGCFPKQAWLDVGGFDEEYDAGWGYDNVDFADRCQMAGYRIYLDCDNPVYCFSHIQIFGEQKVRDAAPNNCALYNRKSRAFHRGDAPWKLNFA